MVAQAADHLGFRDGLCGLAADSRDPHQRRGSCQGVAIHLLGRQLQHRAEQPDSRITDLELCSVNADGQAPGPGGQVIAAQGPLAPLVQPPLGVQGQGCAGMTTPRWSVCRTWASSCMGPPQMTFCYSRRMVCRERPPRRSVNHHRRYYPTARNATEGVPYRGFQSLLESYKPT